ncbi:MAG: benzoate-CoA ligase family protein [Hyphomicrobiaceae bacterium]|nr:benzoate-CoA ligase family protein [Hyphomicrobiaceae bacterium]
MDYPRIYNAAHDLVDRHLAEGREAKVAFIDPSRTLTYGELARSSNRMANLLRALGIPRETRIAVLLHDTFDYPVAFFGAIKAGVVPVALNTLLTAEQYRYILDDSRAKALVVSQPLLATLQPILAELPFLTHLIVAGGAAPPYGFTLTEELEQQPDTGELAPTCADEVAFWLYSSGSTGMPKGARHVHTSMMDTARLYGQPVLGIREDDVVFSAAKLFFAYGLGNGMSMPLSVGATTVLLPERPTPASVFRTLLQHRPTIFYGVPTLYAAMLAAPPGETGNPFASVRWCVSAGEALPAEVGRNFKARFGVDILDGVGSTEMLHIYVSNRPGDIRYGTSGKPVAGYEVRLVDEAGKDVGPGEIGEMVVSGPSAADGYWNQRTKSRATFEGRWMRTGDKYTRDAEGYYTYSGRTDDMFKVSGIWVSPFEVESALVSHPAVLEAAVVPAADGEDLLKPKAFVVLQEGQTGGSALSETLQELVKAKAGPWKYPRWIVYTDSLPKTATGKIQRFKLREL